MSALVSAAVVLWQGLDHLATYAFACLSADAVRFPHVFAGWSRSLNAGSTVASTTCSGSTIGTTASGSATDGSYAALASAASSNYEVGSLFASRVCKRADVGIRAKAHLRTSDIGTRATS